MGDSIKIRFSENFWPSKNVQSIGFIELSAETVSGLMNLPVLQEGDEKFVLLKFTEIGIVSVVENSNERVMDIYVDEGLDPFLAADVVDEELGKTVPINWPSGYLEYRKDSRLN